MSLEISSITVNNKTFETGQPVDVRLGDVGLSWEVQSNSASIFQSAYILRLSTSNIAWGTDSFSGSTFATPWISSSASNASIPRKRLLRNRTYFGQFKIRSSNNEYTDWQKFSFTVNRLPSVIFANITPTSPREGEPLVLFYQFTESDAKARIKWFRNGVNLVQFDNYDRIPGSYVRYQDSWFAEVTPEDKLELGPSLMSQRVFVSKLPPVASDVRILPTDPTPNDFLEASYLIRDQNSGQRLINDKSSISWFLNDVEVEEARDHGSVRFDFSVGDRVYFVLTPSDGQFAGEAVTSPEVQISESSFKILNIRVDGKSNNIGINSVNPSVEWDVIEPPGRVSRFAHIKIGTAPGASNIYDNVIETFSEQFSIPDDLISRGVDYYVSVAASDSSDSFDSYLTTHFRVAGSLWEQNVSNSKGWTAEASMLVTSGEGFQRISLADGSRFAELRVFPQEIRLLLGDSQSISFQSDMTVMRNIMIAALGDNIRVFIENDLVIDGNGMFTQPTSDRFIEIGSTADSTVSAEVKRFRYTVEGYFDPSVDPTPFSQIHAESFVEFTGESISSLTSHEGDMLVSTNPEDPFESGAIYRINEDALPLTASVENIDDFALNINSISTSPDGNRSFINHSKGASYFDSLFMNSFDQLSVFNAGVDPQSDLWELVQTTPFNAATFSSDGLLIDTTFANQSRVDSRLLYTSQNNIPALSIEYKFGDANFDIFYEIEITDTDLIIYYDNLGSSFTIPLADKSVQDLADELNRTDLDFATNPLFRVVFGFLFQVNALGNTTNQPASNLSTFNGGSPGVGVNLLPVDAVNNGFTVLRGTFLEIDPYNPDPYSKTSGGKWYYTHRRPGTPWVNGVFADRGWTIDFDAQIESAEDSDRPSDTDKPEGAGLYINDGRYRETLYLLPQEVIVESSERSYVIDGTQKNKYRVVGKNGSIKVYAKTPSSPNYNLLIDSIMRNDASNESNSFRPRVCSDGINMYAVWHDDGNSGRRQIYFTENLQGSGWSDPQLIVSDRFNASHPDITVDQNGNLFVVFESTSSDYTDIFCIQRSESQWSDAYPVSSNVDNSLRPRVDSDLKNNIHVVWEDYRLGNPQIYYAFRDGATGRWWSGAFGQGDTRLTKNQGGSRRPAIHIAGNTPYVAWTDISSDGSTSIRAGYHMGPGYPYTESQLQRAQEKFEAGQIDFQPRIGWNTGNLGLSPQTISALGKICDFVDLVSDAKGNVHFAWQQLEDGVWQIYGRRTSGRIQVSGAPQVITTGTRDSQYPSLLADRGSSYVYCAFEKSFSNYQDSDDPYSQDLAAGDLDSQLYLARFNSDLRIWESSASLNTVEGETYGGFDVLLDPPDKRKSSRPVISQLADSNIHILYESLMEASSDFELDFSDQSSAIQAAVYNKEWSPVYELSQDPYLAFDRDLRLSGTDFRKEIRFGDFSSNIGCRMRIDRIRYSVQGSIDPFNIGLISSATSGLPKVNVLSSAVNNFGDAWLGTDKGLFFYDRKQNEIFSFANEESIAEAEIRDLTFDRFSNMFLATDRGVYCSVNHANFTLLQGDGIPSDATTIDCDSDRKVYIGSKQGAAIVDTGPLLAILGVSSSDDSVQLNKIISLSVENGLPSNNVTKIRVDENDVAWLGTTQGLVRYKDGTLSAFTSQNGLPANKVQDIAIKDSATRFIATTSGIARMTGISLERLDFGSTIAPPVTFRETDSPAILTPQLTNVRAIVWRDPSTLLVATSHDLYQITLDGEDFGTERVKISRFRSNDFTLTTVNTEQNDDLRTFRLIGIDDVVIPNNIVYEVVLNGHKITRGYKFSPAKKLLFFDYPLKFTDIVQVNIRFDVELVARLNQNAASQIAEGIKITDIKKMLSANGGIYALTSGDDNSLKVNDETTNLPFDRITLDTEPPIAKLRLGDQITRQQIEANIEQVEGDQGLIPFDNVSGIDRMIISNFPNFTSDGNTPQDPVPFRTFAAHDLGVIFEDTSKQYQFSNERGSRLLLWSKSGEEPRLVAATSNPARIYIYNDSTGSFEQTAVFDNGDSRTTIEFLSQFQDRIIVGTGTSASGQTAKIHISLNGIDFTTIGSIDQPYAYCSEVWQNKLLIGAGGTEGQIYSFDGKDFVTEFTGLSSAVYDITVAQNDIYAGTGSQGRIYRLNPRTRTSQILATDSDPQILSIGSALIGSKQFVFAGTGSTASIKRSTLPNGAFVSSFKTINAPVHVITNANDQLYAAIGRTLYSLQNVWVAEYTHDEDILDIIGDGSSLWFISESGIYKISNEQEIRRVYLKLIDRAGNETNLYTDDARTQLDPNLFDEVAIEDLADFTNQNRILEVDEFGDTVGTFDGGDRFYSADKVDVEEGVYYSEIFNGTNGLIAWDNIEWVATIPQGTSMTIQVRTGGSRDEVLDAEFNVVFDGKEGSGDIGFLSGQYLQFKVTMTSQIRSLSPSLQSVVVKSLAADSTHFFTTNFVLPSRVKSGILTSTKMIPVAADIVFGVNLNNSTDFAEYQIIDENRVFTSDDNQSGNNFRVGVRLLTPSRSESIAEDFGEYGPYNSMLMFNSVNFDFENSTTQADLYHFRISFFEDADQAMLVYQTSSQDSTAGWSVDGELMSSSGASISSSSSASISYAPVGDNPIACNTYYYVKIEAIDSQNNFALISDSSSFIEACGATFVDEITFDYTNETAQPNTYSFRIRFYLNPERTNLALTLFSGNDSSGWFSDQTNPIPAEGILINSNETKEITLKPDLSQFSTTQTYFLSIDAFDGQQFIGSSDSFTFRARDLDYSIYCGEYVDVPVLKNFSVIFELEGNQFVTLRG